MLGLKYMMAKSKELTSKLELSSVVGGARTTNPDASSSVGSIAGSDAVAAQSPSESDALSSSTALEGQAFLVAQSRDWDVVLAHHSKLLKSGDDLSDELVRARKRLQDQVESEAYVAQHFHEIARVREAISAIRGLVEKIAVDVEDVEQLLVLQTEEHVAAQNASFVAQQEHELERFEARILEEKEDRTRQLLETRRHVLAAAFQNDLKTYQTLVAYQGPVLLQQRAIAAAAEAQESSPPHEQESLESVDLVVTTDAAQLEAFYDTEEEEEEEEEEEMEETEEGKVPDFVEEEEKEEEIVEEEEKNKEEHATVLEAEKLEDPGEDTPPIQETAEECEEETSEEEVVVA